MSHASGFNVANSRDLAVPRLCYGTLAISPLQRSFSVDEASALISHAARLGVSWIDTAEYYDNYQLLVPALEEFEDIHVITKSYAYQAHAARRAIDDATNILGRSFIDVMLLHEQESSDTVRGHMDALRIYRDLKSQGILGAVGLSTHRVAGVRAAIHYQMNAICAIINVEGIGIVDGSLSDMERALSDAHDAGMLTIGMKALGGGHLISQRDDAMRYILSQKYLDLVAIGMASRDEIDYNAALFLGKVPDHDSALSSANASRTLMIEEGCVGCGLCIGRCRQGAIKLRDGLAVALPDRCIRCGYCARVCPSVCIKIV